MLFVVGIIHNHSYNFLVLKVQCLRCTYCVETKMVTKQIWLSNNLMLDTAIFTPAFNMAHTYSVMWLRTVSAVYTLFLNFRMNTHPLHLPKEIIRCIFCKINGLIEKF